jgi:hypothetical protein
LLGQRVQVLVREAVPIGGERPKPSHHQLAIEHQVRASAPIEGGRWNFPHGPPEAISDQVPDLPSRGLAAYFIVIGFVLIRSVGHRSYAREDV